MTTKSPFEIRTRMLELATEYLQDQYKANEEFAKQSFVEMVRTGQALQEDWVKHAPKMYDFTEIIKKAQELYGFVSKRD
jgi:hypothetical protein